MTDNRQFIKELEDAGLYDLLMELHEQTHSPTNCFCTTEVSGPYRKVLEVIAQRDQQRLAAVLAEMPKKYEAPGLHRSELSDREYTKQVYYNLGVGHCESAITATLAPDTTNGVEETQ
jgi:hypothetical protein